MVDNPNDLPLEVTVSSRRGDGPFRLVEISDDVWQTTETIAHADLGSGDCISFFARAEDTRNGRVLRSDPRDLCGTVFPTTIANSRLANARLFTLNGGDTGPQIVVPNEILLTFNPEVYPDEDAVNRFLRERGWDVIGQLPPVYQIGIPTQSSAQEMQSLLNSLRAASGVSNAEPNGALDPGLRSKLEPGGNR